MYGTGGRKVVVFDLFQRHVEIVRKLVKKCFNPLIFQFNDLRSACLVSSDKYNSTVSNFCLLLVMYYGFWPKNRSRSLSLPCSGSNLMTSLRHYL